MTTSTALRAAILAGLLVSFHAALADDAKPLKTEIENYIHRIESASGGRLHWEGADSFDVKKSGDTAVATIAAAHISFHKQPGDQAPAFSVTLDRMEIRRTPAAGGANLTEYAIALPAMVSVGAADATQLTLSLKEGHIGFTLEAPGDHQRSASLTLAGARLEQKNHDDYLALGPVTANWKLIRTESGGWHAPLDFELKNVNFLAPEAPIAGTVARIGYAGESAGTSLADLDALRDKMADIREHDSADQKAADWLVLLPKLISVFGASKGDLSVENIMATKPSGETQVALTKATLGGELSGLDGEKATLVVTTGFEGLTIAPSLVPEVRVPLRGSFDLALEDVATSALQMLAQAATDTRPGAPDDVRQKAMQQLVIAAMSLNPVLRLREASVDFKNVKIAATGEAKRAPPLPIGYAATADIAVRGFGALPDIVTNNLSRAYLPLLKFIGAVESAGDGTATIKFHLDSAIGKAISVNGSNLAAWFGPHAANGPSQMRPLLLTDPPMTGDDVSAVQKALPAGKKGMLTAGTYDTATALAVAQFQKDNGLNVDGVVDAKTREKLGIAPPAAPPPPKPMPPPQPALPKN